MPNLVVHFEIHASEPQKLIDFYSGLLGWTFQDYGGGDQPYWVIDTGEGAIGNVAGQPGMGINGGLTQRMGPRPEIGAPTRSCAGASSSARPRRCPRPTGLGSAAVAICSIRTATSSG
jgi:hypothetical protein